MSEVLTKKDFDKVLPIIEILQEKGSITPGEAVKVCDRSPATIRRYLNILTDTDYVVARGNTNQSTYHLADGMRLMRKE